MKIENKNTYLIIPNSQLTDFECLNKLLDQNSQNIKLIYFSELTLINSDDNYIFCYTAPWEVIESAYYLGNSIFLDNPYKIYELWQENSRKIIDYHKNYDNCYLVNLNTFYRHPENSIKKINDKIQINLSFNNLIPSSISYSNVAARITEICFPNLIEIFRDLDYCALISSSNSQEIQEQLRFNKSDLLQPIISIIIPCYNQGIFLVETILSIEKFSPDETELIIIDDGSTEEETIRIIDSLKNAGYRIIRQANQGLANTRNNLFELAKADYILPVDSDNKICENFIQESIKILDANSEIGIVYGYRKDFGMRNVFAEVIDFCLEQLITINFIDACAVVRKQMWIDCHGYDSNVIALEDWELWIHAASKKWKFHRLEFQTFEYRVRPNSMITRLKDIELSKKNHNIIFGKHSEFISESYKNICVNYRQKIENSENQAKNLVSENNQLTQELKDIRCLLLESQNKSEIKSFKIMELENQLLQIQNSKSWKVTKIFRKLKIYLKSWNSFSKN